MTIRFQWITLPFQNILKASYILFDTPSRPEFNAKVSLYHFNSNFHWQHGIRGPLFHVEQQAYPYPLLAYQQEQDVDIGRRYTGDSGGLPYRGGADTVEFLTRLGGDGIDRKEVESVRNMHML